jgi:glycerol transport system ATP-binding protein
MAAACTIAWTPEGRSTLAFRPHHLVPDEGSSGAHRFEVEALSSEIMGSESFVHVAFGAARWVMLVNGAQVPAPGDRLRVSLEPRQAMFFGDTGAVLSGDGSE